MKTVLQAFLGSIIFHVIYFAGMILVGYIQTKSYEADFESAREEVEILQNEVAFGMIISPLFLLLSIVGVTAVWGTFILVYKKLFN